MRCARRSGATAARSRTFGPTISPRSPSRARRANRRRRRDAIDDVYLRRGQPKRRRQPQRRAHGRRCWPGLPVEVPGVTVNRLVRIGPAGDQLRRAGDRLRRGRRDDRRRRRVDDARAVRAAQERRPPSAARQELYDTVARLAHDQSEDAARNGRFRWARRPRKSPSNTASRARTKTRSRSSRSSNASRNGARSFRRGDRCGGRVRAEAAPRRGRMRRTSAPDTTLETLAQLKPAFARPAAR